MQAACAPIDGIPMMKAVLAVMRASRSGAGCAAANAPPTTPVAARAAAMLA